MGHGNVVKIHRNTGGGQLSYLHYGHDSYLLSYLRTPILITTLDTFLYLYSIILYSYSHTVTQNERLMLHLQLGIKALKTHFKK